MSQLIPLLQAEVRMLADELAESVRMAQTPATANAGLARWTRRAQALVGALSVLGRERWSRLAQALHGIGIAGRAEQLLHPATERALKGLAEFARWEPDGVEQQLDAFDPELDRLLTALTSDVEANRGPEVPPGPLPAQSNPLLPLYRHEADEQCARMGQWLLQLEQEPERVELIVPVMRAAHSIKGASRVVGLQTAVELAHALEDRLQAAQRAGGAVPEAVLEYALSSVDLLRELAQRGTTADLLQRCEQHLAQAPKIEQLPAPVASGPDSGQGRPAPLNYLAGQESDPVLRIKASLVGRLIALAGSSVVGGRRLKPFSERQQRLRRQIVQLGRGIDELYHMLGAPGPETALGAHFAELRRSVLATRKQTQHWIDDFSDYARAASDLSERIYQVASTTRLRPFRDLVLGYPRMVRDLARQLGKRARLSIVGESVDVDRDVLEKLDAPLTHLLRNAIDHGLEPSALRMAAGKPEEGSIRVLASHRAGMLVIEVSDDGAGIDIEAVRRRVVELGRMSHEAAAAQTSHALCQHLFSPGFSTRQEVTEVSGRGVGLDVVREGVERLGGSIRISTEARKGTSFHLQVPISRAVTRALAVRVAGELYAFPSLRIERVLRASRAELVVSEGLHYLPLDGRNIGLIPLADTLDLGSTRQHEDRLDLVVVAHQGRLVGLMVEDFLGEYDLATRPLDPRLGRVADLGAVAVLPDGSPVVLLDVDDLMRSALAREHRISIKPQADEPTRRKRVLVADDSISVRELERQLLLAQGYQVDVAVDGMDAWNRVRDEAFDLLVTDLDMPRMDGIELTRSIKQDPRLRALPIIVVSYRDSAEDRRKGLEARADRYLTKTDFDGTSFLNVVRQLIGGAGEAD